MSEPGAEVLIAVAARNEDGSGRLVATFNGPAFLQDLEAVLRLEDRLNDIIAEGREERGSSGD